MAKMHSANHLYIAAAVATRIILRHKKLAVLLVTMQVNNTVKN